MQAAFRWLEHQTTTPQFAYSLESDYESVGLSLNHTIDLNEKNTTLAFGVAGTYDTIMPEFWLGTERHKKSGDLLVGVTQLLGPRTVFSCSFTLGTSEGYLSDPYKGFRFSYNPDPNRLFPEKRPRERTKQVASFSLTRYFRPGTADFGASAELSYRFYHDSYGIFTHTVSLSWFQKLGGHVVLTPLVRFSDQTAASFYATELPGDPSCPATDPFCPQVAIPRSYSSDYRLSRLQTVTCGLSCTMRVHEMVSLDLGYRRYQMAGTDHNTSGSAYPSANNWSAGFRIWF